MTSDNGHLKFGRALMRKSQYLEISSVPNFCVSCEIVVPFETFQAVSQKQSRQFFFENFWWKKILKIQFSKKFLEKITLFSKN